MSPIKILRDLFKMEKVLVIGSNAFSGIDFIDLLLEKGGYEVIGVSRSPEKKDFFLTFRRHRSSHYRFFQIDLNRETDKLSDLILSEKPDYIVNFAALVEVGPSWNHPEHWFQTNAVTVIRLAQILTKCPFVKKYVHISTPEVYGSCEGAVDEKVSFNPSTPYAASKAAGDLALTAYRKNFHLPICFIRSTNVYGPGQSLFKIIPKVALCIKKGIKIPLHGGGKAVKSYIHIRDISEGELAVMLRGRPGEVYHFSPDDQGIAVRDLIGLICQRMGVSFENTVEEVGERLGQDKAYIIDSSKARREFNWQPKIALTEGVDGVIDWVTKNYDAMKEESLEYVHKE